jgi:hypothetical protein
MKGVLGLLAALASMILGQFAFGVDARAQSENT